MHGDSDLEHFLDGHSGSRLLAGGFVDGSCLLIRTLYMVSRGRTLFQIEQDACGPSYLRGSGKLKGDETSAMTPERTDATLPTLMLVTGCILWLLPIMSALGSSYDSFDVVSGVIQAPQFKDVPPLQKLRLTADLIRNRKLKDSDMSFAILDWGDRDLREPPDPYDRLKRWLDMVNDDQLSSLKLPRDYLNRTLVSQYLVEKTNYLRSAPGTRNCYY